MTMTAEDETPPSGWGVLHEWLEHDEVHAYLFGPLPSKRDADRALNSFGCDCKTKVIPINFPADVVMHVRTDIMPPPTGTPLLPERLH
jgi:hypothetical protein